MLKRAVAFVLKLVVTTGLFVLLFRPEIFGMAPDFWGRDISFRTLMDGIRSVETHNIVLWLALAAAVKALGILCGVVRWRLLLRGQGLRVPFWYAVQSWFIGRSIGIFLPGTLGLDGYRLYDSARYTGEIIKSTTVIAVEKLIGFISLTFLVFLTFPLGYRLLHFNVPLLILSMTIFGGFVVVSFLLLLNPRVIQVLVAVIPTPRSVRSKLNKLGTSVTAYSGNRLLLLMAVALGVGVHAATCLMFFCTMSAVRAGNTTIYDILFTSPLMIWGTVLGPSVGGEGIREIVFIAVLGAKTGAAKAFLMSHLGWWAGDVPPFLIGLAVFLFRSRKKETGAQPARGTSPSLSFGFGDALPSGASLSPEEVREYRDRFLRYAGVGALGGLLAGAIVGLVEAAWILNMLGGLSEFAMFWWGVLWYGLIFAGVGLGIAAFLTFLFLLMDRFPRTRAVFALCLGGSAAAGVLVIGMFRFGRDVLEGHHMSIAHFAGVLGVAGAAGALLFLLGLAVSALCGGWKKAVLASAGAYLALLVAGIIAAKCMVPAAAARAFTPAAKAAGPNVILIAVDALRADHLSLYSPEAVAKTPNLASFAKDAVTYDKAFSQASWTKPAFATIFSGLYPESHRATSKTAALPLGVVTFPELLQQAGYYTIGFANNPHISTLFHFDQGFTEYEDLKPTLFFGATSSASKLSLYEILRRARQKVMERLLGGRITVTDFYQPAEIVTRCAVDWMDGAGRPSDAPFFLFLHYMDPHDPFMDWEHPGVGYARVRNEHPDPNESLEPMRRAYNSEIEHLDRYLGDLFQCLRNSGLYDDALIILVADHGEEFQEHHGWWHGQTLYDEVTHIPLLVKLPKNVLGGTANADLARQIDIAPTILHFAGLEKAQAMSGRPLITRDGAFTNGDVTFVYAENDFDGNILQSARTKDAKLIHANPDNTRDLAPLELYDLTQDPKETANKAGADDPREADLDRVVKDMQGFIKQNAAEPTLRENIPADIQEQTRSIGYL